MKDLGFIVMFVIGAFADGKITSDELTEFFRLLSRFLSSEGSSLSAAKSSEDEIESLTFSIRENANWEAYRFSFLNVDEGLHLGSTVEPADKSS